MTIVELLDPLGWVGEPVATGDSECREVTVFDVAIGGLREGVDVSDEMGLQEFDSFIEVIQLLLVTLFLGGQFLLEVM